MRIAAEFGISLATRVLTPEVMDDPGLDPIQHRQALGGLSRLNRVSASARLLWRPLAELAAVPGHPPLRVLDLATGSGDLPLALARKSQRAGLPITFAACDASETALAVARERAGNVVEFFRLDVLGEVLPPDFDVIVCSLFMHHLRTEQAIDLLYRMKTSARRMVVVSDLRRSRVGYLLAGAGSRLLSRSSVVHTDALKSVRAAFTVDEFAEVASRAGLEDATLECRAPCRFVLTWRRKG